MPSLRPPEWTLPERPWVLHSTPGLGTVTERWIETQTETTDRYGSRLLGLHAVDGASPRPHWLLASDRRDLHLSYRGMHRSEGLSPAWLARTFRGERAPSVVHAHFGPPAAGLTRFAAALRSPLFASFYGFDATLEEYVHGKQWKRRYARLFAAAAGCIAEGPRMGERVAALGCPEDKVEVVRLPADAEQLAEVEVRRADRFRAVMAGRFIEKKGFDTGIRAFGAAFADTPDAELVIIGGGPLEDELKRVAQESGLSDRIVWGGRLAFREFMTLIATAHVGLHPSRTASDGDSEGGAPVTLIEAQWLGVPSIVSVHDDLPFVAGPDAVKLDPAAVGDWTDALRALYESPGRLDEMAMAAQRFARDHHSPIANARSRETIYDAATH